MICFACRSVLRRTAQLGLQEYRQTRSYRVKGAKGKKIPVAEARLAPTRIERLPPRPFLATQDSMLQALEALDGRPRSSIVSQVHSKGWFLPAITDKSLIDRIIDVAGLEQFEGKTILEMNPGPGLLAERLIERVKPKQYIALEARKSFLDALATLNTIVPEGQKTDITIRHTDGFHWKSFSDLQRDGIMKSDDLSHNRADLNPNLVFIAMAKAAQTEQLVAQWLDTLGTRSWIQQWGRVKMYLFVPLNLRQKLLATTGSPLRTKGTFIREATCDVREIVYNPFLQNPLHEGRISFQEVFEDKPQYLESIKARPDQYYPATALSLLEIVPYKERRVEARWETFEFIVKTLLMNKSTPLHRQIRTIASGAYALLADLPADLRTKWPQDMTVHEMDLIAQAFDKWPFKPKFLNIVTAELPEGQRSKKYGRLIRSQATIDGGLLDIYGEAESMYDDEEAMSETAA